MATKEKVVEVLVPELTVPKAVAEFDDGKGGSVYQQVGEVRFKGDKLAQSEVSPAVLAVLEDSDHPNHEAMSKKLALVSGDAEDNLAVRLGLPFDGYDDMDEEDILAAMRVLPSPTVEAIKEYERQHENRPAIVQYSIGFGVSPNDFTESVVGSEVQDGAQEKKAVSRLKTRKVTDDGVEPGEGFTGTGDPQIPYGTEAEAEESGTKRTRSRSSSSGKKKSSGGGSTRRRSRRSRSTSSGSSSGEGSGSSSGSGSSE